MLRGFGFKCRNCFRHWRSFFARNYMFCWNTSATARQWTLRKEKTRSRYQARSDDTEMHIALARSVLQIRQRTFYDAYDPIC